MRKDKIRYHKKKKRHVLLCERPDLILSAIGLSIVEKNSTEFKHGANRLVVLV